MILPKIQPIKAVKIIKEVIKEEKVLRDKALRDFVETIINSTIIAFKKKVLKVRIYELDKNKIKAHKFFSIGEEGIYLSPYDFLGEFNRFIKEVSSSMGWRWSLTIINYSSYGNAIELSIIHMGYCYSLHISIEEVNRRFYEDIH